MQPNIAFIGAGNMSRAIFGGMLANGYPAEKITATGRDINKLADLADQGMHVTTDNGAAMASADIVFLALKPQLMHSVISPLADLAQQHKPLIVSVAAGITADSINRWLGGNLAIIRCMPNTPALVQQGASALCANQQVSAQQKQQVQTMIASTGIALWVETEEQLDVVTALSGSGPAYFFMLMESMINAAVAQGLPKDIAQQLALQTAQGAATIAQHSDVDPAELRRRVTSPKGTTEQAILYFEQENFPEIIKQGMQKNINRSKQLAVELG
ncbi:MAG: pyrroline-5-carboxylate reductase [Osedax symbiont Rs1]|nr:MAG: pyrroline-5-carboxylate reductase [Osedax symbiont Rs1]